MIRKWIEKLNIYFKCSLISSIFLFVLSFIFIPIDIKFGIDLANGLSLGIALNIVFYILLGIFEDHLPNSHKWAIVISIIRYFVFAALLVVVGLCYYKLGIRFINLFTYVIGYIFVFVIFLVLYALNRKESNGNN